MDRDIQDSLRHTASTEAQLNHVWNVATVQLGSESNSDVRIMDDPSTSSLGKITQYTFPAPAADKLAPAKINYHVVDHGKDPDMEGTMNSLRIAQDQVSHKLIMGTADSKAKWHNVAKDTLYNYYPKLDGDVVDTNHNLDIAENQLGKSFVQLRSDPITSSLGEVTQYLHPESKDAPVKMNYPVPNFGVDQEILDHDANLAKTETELNHKFVPTKSEPGGGPPAVPNFGVDLDIIDSTQSIS